MSHHIVRQIVALHFYYCLEFLLRVVLRFLYVHRYSATHWLLPLLPDFQFVIQPDDRVLCLEFNLLETLVQVPPKAAAKYLLVIKRVADQPFNLLLYGPVEVLQRVRNYFFLLVLK